MVTLKNTNSMEKAKFLEAKKQVDIIDACNIVIEDNKIDEISLMFPIPEETRNTYIIKLIYQDLKVTRSFLRWVENEKAIAEQKLKEI